MLRRPFPNPSTGGDNGRGEIEPAPNADDRDPSQSTFPSGRWRLYISRLHIPARPIPAWRWRLRGSRNDWQLASHNFSGHPPHGPPCARTTRIGTGLWFATRNFLPRRENAWWQPPTFLERRERCRVENKRHPLFYVLENRREISHKIFARHQISPR